MKLTKQLRRCLVERFKAGATMSEIGVWYGKGTLAIEGVIREWMIEQDRQEARDEAGQIQLPS